MDNWWLSLHGLVGMTEHVTGAPATRDDGLRLTLGASEWELAGEAGGSATLSDIDGVTIYADLDGDGNIDHISTVHNDGRQEVFSADPHRAAWGLMGDNEEERSQSGRSPWGLPVDGTPALGGEMSGVPQIIGTWHRIR